MNESAMRYVNRIKEYWNKFSKTQKIVFLATVVLFALTVGLVSYNLSKTEYAQAFTDLQPGDAAAIKQYLDTSKIPYKLSEDGRSIGVPRTDVAKVKLDVESQGLNKSGNIGYGAFRETNMFGTTDNEFSIKKLDMIQGELQQLINSNQAVSGSKVVITLPEQSVFLKQNDTSQLSTASVVIQLKPGYTLDQNKIDTMYQLVSKSVKNLPIENITISDQNGDLLAYSKGSGTTLTSATAASMQFEIKKQFEQDLRKNVKELLGGILGPNKVLPMVIATMNFDKKSTVQNLVTPVNTVDQKGIEISVNEIQKSYTSDGAAAGGVVGTGGTDVPNYPSTSQGGKSNSEETQKTVNYDVNRITNQIESSPFSLTDLTISVGIEPPDPKNLDSLSQQTKDAIQKLLVSVVSSSLANSGKTFTPAELEGKVNVFTSSFSGGTAPAKTATTNWALYGGLGLAALALAGLGGYMLSRRKKAKETEEAAAMLPPRMEYPSVDLEHVTNDNQMRKQLETLAKKKPEEFVNLLRTWLVDE